MDTLSFLGDMAPGFPINGQKVKVLQKPEQFYQELCTRATESRKRIVISALYLGTGDKAQHLVDCVKSSLQSSKGQTRITVLLDHCRGNRVVDGKSSCTMLLPLVQGFPVSKENAQVSTSSLHV